jgi:hypothetical protein
MTAQAEHPRGGQGRRVAVWGGAAALLSIPALATQVSGEMAWDSGDFMLLGTMLLAACGLWEILMRKSDSWAYRAGAGVAVGTAFFLFLAAGAVGIIGSEDERVNLLYLGVIAIGLAGALAARFRSRGMARAMAVTAAAHVLAGIVGVVLVPDVKGFVVATALFTPMWLASAWLFSRAAR